MNYSSHLRLVICLSIHFCHHRQRMGEEMFIEVEKMLSRQPPLLYTALAFVLYSDCVSEWNVIWWFVLNDLALKCWRLFFRKEFSSSSSKKSLPVTSSDWTSGLRSLKLINEKPNKEWIQSNWCESFCFY